VILGSIHVPSPVTKSGRLVRSCYVHILIWVFVKLIWCCEKKFWSNLLSHGKGPSYWLWFTFCAAVSPAIFYPLPSLVGSFVGSNVPILSKYAILDYFIYHFGASILYFMQSYFMLYKNATSSHHCDLFGTVCWHCISLDWYVWNIGFCWNIHSVKSFHKNTQSLMWINLWWKCDFCIRSFEDPNEMHPQYLTLMLLHVVNKVFLVNTGRIFMAFLWGILSNIIAVNATHDLFGKM